MGLSEASGLPRRARVAGSEGLITSPHEDGHVQDDVSSARPDPRSHRAYASSPLDKLV